ncbi:MAG: hypothetical protein M3O30_14835 [Planctomycetota bacterium]|nr:hypothetical protein [Planctomycetota bacterium]
MEENAMTDSVGQPHHPLSCTPIPWPKTRAAAITCGLFLLLLTFFALAGPSWGLAIYRLSVDGATVTIWLIASAGIGWVIWRRLAPQISTQRVHPILALITCAALGIGAMSLLILGLGLASWLNKPTAWGLIAVGLVAAAIFVFPRRNAFDARAWLAAPASWHWLWAMLMPLIAIAIIGAFFPPGLLWGDEPHGYDVVEYHLQIPREWFEAGRIIPLHHNVFSYFPFNVEMHFLLAMHLRGNPWSGVYLAQLMQTALWVLSLLAIYGVAGGGAGGTIAAVFAGAVPWTMFLASVAYNEGGMVLFATLALGWALQAKSLRQFAIAGIMAGFACGVKLPAAPLLILGVPIALMLFHPQNDSAPTPTPRITLVKGCVIYLLCALLALSPWLIRNIAWTGNPVFPEAMSILGKAHFSDIQVIRWQRAYLPAPAYRSIPGHLKALAVEVLVNRLYGLIFIPLGLAAIVLSFRSRVVLYLLMLLAMQTLVWLLFTHLQGRFMVMLIPLVALIIAQPRGRDWIAFCAIVAIALVGISGQMLLTKIARYIVADHKIYAENKAAGMDVPYGLIGKEKFSLGLVDTDSLPDDAVIDLVGDAAALRYQIPMSRLHYKTVFDVDTTDLSKNILADWLAGMPQTNFVLTDTNELNRFAQTYYGIPPLKPKAPAALPGPISPP